MSKKIIKYVFVAVGLSSVIFGMFISAFSVLGLYIAVICSLAGVGLINGIPSFDTITTGRQQTTVSATPASPNPMDMYTQQQSWAPKLESPAPNPAPKIEPKVPIIKVNPPEPKLALEERILSRMIKAESLTPDLIKKLIREEKEKENVL